MHLQCTAGRDSCEEDLELIDRAEDTVDNNTNAADMDTGSAMTVELTMPVMQTEERRVDSLILSPFFTYNSPLLKGQPKFCQSKHVFWNTCPADDFEKK